jgi:hypothetical protein
MAGDLSALYGVAGADTGATGCLTTTRAREEKQRMDELDWALQRLALDLVTGTPVDVAAEVAKLGTPQQISDRIAEYAQSAPPVAECFRCAHATPFDTDIGEACTQEGCAGRYIKCT